MNSNQNDKNLIIKEFDKKCKENNIWYSLVNISLLEAMSNTILTNNNFVEVMMSIESFSKMKKKFEKNILDISINSDFCFFIPIYFDPKFKSIIKISILVPANINKTQKVYSIKNLIRQKISFFNFLKFNNLNFEMKLKKIFYKFLNLFLSPINWIEIYSNIYDENYDGYFLIDSFNKNINKKWLHTLTKNLLNVNWISNDVLVIEENDIFLKKNYGLNWNKTPKLYKDYNYELIKNQIIN